MCGRAEWPRELSELASTESGGLLRGANDGDDVLALSRGVPAQPPKAEPDKQASPLDPQVLGILMGQPHRDIRFVVSQRMSVPAPGLAGTSFGASQGVTLSGGSLKSEFTPTHIINVHIFQVASLNVRILRS